jgi:hypothetical protein
MHRSIAYLVCATCLFVLSPARAGAQQNVVPAGTLIHCTMDEPNLSSRTVAVGDPVLCYLTTVQEFGRIVFPRGSYLQGHIDAEKDPGHFWGKGYIALVFDHIGLPAADASAAAKMVAVRGYPVNRDGAIMGKGHAKRDAVEWLFPLLWPWKLIMLPARGPRPTLKGEQQLTLRLMEDIVVPVNLTPPSTGWHYFQQPGF